MKHQLHRYSALRHLAGAVWFATALVGCQPQSSSGTPSSSATEQSLSAKEIGMPCEPKDGWQHSPVADQPAGNPGGNLPDVARADEIPKGYQKSPPRGVPHCLTGGIYPHGYMSAHCADDSDCPNGTVCDCPPEADCNDDNPGQCRLPCTSDAECTAPSTCSDNSFVRYCKCDECEPDGP
jgi:hypothetical protein